MQGARPLKVRFINWYIGKLHMAARHDARLATAFLEVANLEAPPTRLLHPAVVMRVFRGNLGRRSGRAEVGQSAFSLNYTLERAPEIRTAEIKEMHKPR